MGYTLPFFAQGQLKTSGLGANFDYRSQGDQGLELHKGGGFFTLNVKIAGFDQRLKTPFFMLFEQPSGFINGWGYTETPEGFTCIWQDSGFDYIFQWCIFELSPLLPLNNQAVLP